MTFHVGQKVQCITGDWSNPWSHLVPHLPRKGGIYHVRGYDPIGNNYIWLAEIVNPPVGGNEPSFLADCFRPIIERKTDISCFTKLLTPAPKTPVDA